MIALALAVAFGAGLFSGVLVVCLCVVGKGLK